MSFIPAWKDKDGNRFLVLAENHVFADAGDARLFVLSDFLWYIPFGWVPDGIVEIELADGKGQILHLPAQGPMRSSLAVIGGPAFDAAVAEGLL